MACRKRPSTPWIALIAAFLLAFHSLVAASALGMLTVSSTAAGVTTIVCTPSGPRVVTLELATPDTSSKANPHSTTIPHCCTAGCAMLGTPVLPALYVLAWYLPQIPVIPAPRAAAPPRAPTAVLAKSPGRPRGPPTA